MKKILVTTIMLVSIILLSSMITPAVLAQVESPFDKNTNIQTVAQQQDPSGGNTGSPSCTLPVPIPKLLSPPDNTIITAGSPLVFQWTPVEDPCGFKYTLQTATNPAFNISVEPIPSWDTNNVPSYTMTPPTYNTLLAGDHYWRVFVTDGKGNLGPPTSPFKYTIQTNPTPNSQTVLIVNGVAEATLPSGVTSAVTFLNPQTGTVTFEKTDIKSKLSSGGTEIKFIGDITEIHPNSASCSSGCIISFEFSQDMIPPGVNTNDLKIFHDINNDGDFQDPGETLDTTVTQVGENLFKASVTIFFNSKFAIGGITIVPALVTLGGVQNQTSAVPEFPIMWVGVITALMIGITIVLARKQQLFRI